MTQQNNDQIIKSKKMQQVLIDKFFVPANAKEEFIQRMNYNGEFIKKLPGFVKGEVYENTDDNGNITCVTVNVWEKEVFFEKTKDAVQVEFKRIDFNPAVFYQRLHIKLERGIYQPMVNK